MQNGTTDADGDSIDTGNNVIIGLSGNDQIDGHEGDNTIFGGSDDDALIAGSGADILYGGHGNDSLFSDGNHTMFGGSGDDLHDAKYGQQMIFGGLGNDTIFAGSGDDNIWGGSGADSIRGHSGDDVINSEGGADTLFGGHGSDTIYLESDETAFVYGGENSGDDDVLDLAAIAGFSIKYQSPQNQENGTIEFQNSDDIVFEGIETIVTSFSSKVNSDVESDELISTGPLPPQYAPFPTDQKDQSPMAKEGKISGDPDAGIDRTNDGLVVKLDDGTEIIFPTIPIDDEDRSEDHEVDLESWCLCGI